MARDCGLETVPVTGEHDGARGRVDAARPRARRDLPVPAAALGARPGRVRQGGPEGAARRRPLPPARAAATTSRTTARSASSSARCRPRSREIFSCAAHRATAELRRALGRLRDRAVRARLGRQGLADRAQPARRHRPAAGGARAASSASAPAPAAACTPSGPTATDLVVHHDGGEVSARHVIVAAQAPHAAPLVAPGGRAGRRRARAADLRRVPERRGRDERDDRDALRRRLRDGHARPRVRHVHQPGARAAPRRPAPARREPDAVRGRPGRRGADARDRRA